MNHSDVKVIRRFLAKGFIPVDSDFSHRHDVVLKDMIALGLVETVDRYYSLSTVGRWLFRFDQ